MPSNKLIILSKILEALKLVKGAILNSGAGLLAHINNLANPHSTSIGNINGGTLSELNTKINDAELDGISQPRVPNGPAGGDLSGNYPDPTLVDVTGVAGAYTNSELTIDSKGRVTVISSGVSRQVDSLGEGTDITIDNTDPANPIVTYNNKINTQIIIKSVSDFPPILNKDKVYIIDGHIDTGTTSINNMNGATIRGLSASTNSLYSTEDNYTMFTGSGFFIHRRLTLSVTGANSKVYDLQGLTTFDVFQANEVIWDNCTSLGELNNYFQGLEGITSRQGGTPELTLSGTWGSYIIERSLGVGLIDGNYSIYKAGTNFMMNSRFVTNHNIDLNTNISLHDFAPINFTNPTTVQLGGCIISRNGMFSADDLTITPNLLKTDLEAYYRDNFGLANTFIGGRNTILSQVTTPIGVQGDYYTFEGTWDVSELSHFDSPIAGALRNIGINPIEFRVETDFVVEGNRERDLAVRARVWDSSEGVFIDYRPQEKPINNLSGGRDVAYFSKIVNVILGTNDYVIFQIANLTDASNVTLESSSYYVIEER